MCDSGWGGGAEEGLKHCANISKINSKCSLIVFSLHNIL